MKTLLFSFFVILLICSCGTKEPQNFYVQNYGLTKAELFEEYNEGISDFSEIKFYVQISLQKPQVFHVETAPLNKNKAGMIVVIGIPFSKDRKMVDSIQFEVIHQRNVRFPRYVSSFDISIEDSGKSCYDYIISLKGKSSNSKPPTNAHKTWINTKKLTLQGKITDLAYAIDNEPKPKDCDGLNFVLKLASDPKICQVEFL
ncbi:MAG: hypothetical protein V3V00_08660 [Saprospiraceae bacterium]